MSSQNGFKKEKPEFYLVNEYILEIFALVEIRVSDPYSFCTDLDTAF